MCLKQDYSSRFRILKGGKISLVVSAMLGSAIIASASPTQGVVTSGTAIISQSGNTTNINQSTQKASINWKDFSIKSNEVVNFNQPNQNSITLNRVVGNEKSVIDGALNANGQVWILNSNGILFNKNAKVNTAGLVATTKELSDKDFQAGNYNFKGDSTNSVINLGTIEVTNNSYVVLASNEVKNSGTIKAIKGKVYLSGASEYTVNLNGNSIVDLVVSKGVLDAMVENSGTIVANGGEIYLTTNAVNELLKGVVNNTGVIEANSLNGLTGKVEVFAHGGATNVSGRIEAKDGFVETSGKNLNITNSAKVTANKWLLDPTNITIESNGGNIGNESVSVTAIQNALSTTNVELQADQDITVNENITWSTDKQLKLTAGDEIYVNATINNTNSTNGGVYFQAANTSDKVIFDTNGKVIINNVNQLQWVNTALNGKYELGSDIDASDTSTWNSGAGFNPIISSYKYTPYPELPNYQITTYVYFTGIFDGNNHTISNLYINYSGGAGLFSVTNNATIKNLGLINVNITGNSVAGGLVGASQNNTLIENSYVTGSITSTSSSAGGLVGDASNATVRNSYSTASVSGQHLIGGLVGNLSNYSSIINSYSTGYVTPVGNAFGGLVGNSSNSSVTNSYWNKDTSGQSTSAGGTGLTSAQFTDSSNFVSWDSSIWAFSGNDFEGYASNVITSPVLRSLFSPTILFEGGYGTDVNPYRITNWTQLQNINNSNILTSNYYFKLLNNLSSSTSDYASKASSSSNSNKGWNPLGNSSSKFAGTFDGNNYTISNLNINNSLSNLGLFGYIDSATIKNLGVIDVNITGGNSARIGAVAGYANGSAISNSYSSGTLVGGGSSRIGGLVGYSYGSLIENSYSKGNIEGGVSSYLGGLVGYNRGDIENSYSLSNVLAGDSSYIGGLVGYNYSSGTILNTYSIGNVVAGNYSIVGGLVGYNVGTITNSYWDTETSGQNTSAGGTGLTTAQFTDSSNFSSWDSSLWKFKDSSIEGYEISLRPYLKDVTTTSDKSTTILFQSGYGTDINPYTITNWTQLQNINNSNILTSNYYFKLLNNLSSSTSDYANLASSTANSGSGWISIGDYTNQFTGTFDGDNYIISNLFINQSSTDFIGLFGYLKSGSTIKNIGVLNINVTGQNSVGGLAGANSGTIENSYSTGFVSSNGSNAGGLVASNLGTIKNSYSTASVSGVDNVGGLVGYNNSGTITNSYSTGAIIGSNSIGGLVGYNGGTVTNSYWDRETSGQSTSAGGTGLTTAQFADSANFSSWDNSIWMFGDNSIAGYALYLRPYLKDVTATSDKPSSSILFQSGYGTQENPYTITNWTQLQNINNSNILTLNYYFKLLNNLNSSTSDYGSQASLIANSNKGWNPIGNSTNKFTGTFDGNNYIINSLNINNSTNGSYLGLFGYINNATIKNLGVTNVNIIGGINSYIGAIVGYANNSTLENLYSTGSIEGDDGSYIGGITGYNAGIIKNTYSSSNVTAGNNSYVGGITGYNSDTLLNLFSFGNISSGSNSNEGGLVGYNGGTITNSYWDRETSGQSTSAGGTGLTTAQFADSANFSSWDNSIWMFGDNSIAGYALYLRPYLKDVTATSDKPSSSILFQSGYGTQENPYTITNWTQLQNINNSNILTLNYYFKLLNNLNSSTSDYGSQASLIANSNKGWNPIGNSTNKFTGTFDGNNYIINSLNINNSTNGSYLGLFGYINNATIKNLGVTNVNIIGGINSYIGAIVGYANNSTILNSYSSGTLLGGVISRIGGLVGYSYGSVVENSYSNTNTEGEDSSYMGGLIGYGSINSRILNSYATGDIISEFFNLYGGGLVGYISSGSIENSYATGNIQIGSGKAGGLVGHVGSNSYIKNSYATGNIISTYDLYGGGLIGEAVGPYINIENSYATGNVEITTDSYVNIGGLIGIYATPGGTIKNSYATGNVKAVLQSSLGGFIGSVTASSSTIENSYATGNVEGNSSIAIGGFIGRNSGIISNSYSTGTVTDTTSSNKGGFIGTNQSGTITNSFWNTQTSGQSTGIGSNNNSQNTIVTGLTSEEFKNILNFSNNGWNITTDSSLSTSLTAPILVTNNGVTSWVLPSYATYVNYALSTISNGYTYTGNELLLSSLWNTNTIFGSNYSSWVLGTDYNFMYNGNVITSFTNAGTYSGIYIDILKSGFTKAISGNTTGSLTITPKTITVVADNKTKVYGDNNPSLTYVATGLINNDTLNGNLNTNATNTSAVGVYDITQGDLVNSNYDITFTKGELTVLAKNEPENPTTPENPTDGGNGNNGGTPTTPENPTDGGNGNNGGTPTTPENPTDGGNGNNGGTPTTPENPTDGGNGNNGGTPTTPENPTDGGNGNNGGTPTTPENPTDGGNGNNGGTPTIPENPTDGGNGNNGGTPTIPENPTNGNTPNKNINNLASVIVKIQTTPLSPNLNTMALGITGGFVGEMPSSIFIANNNVAIINGGVRVPVGLNIINEQNKEAK